VGWFPIFANFIEGEDFKRLTPTEKLYFWHLVSEFNLRGEFYQSDLTIAKTLGTCEKTIRRGRAKLLRMGLIIAKPGTRTKRNKFLATRYLSVKYSIISPEEDRFFAQMPRFTFQVMLYELRKSRLQAGDVVVYVCLQYWFWRNRAKYENRDQFFITKNSLQSLTNLKDALTRIPRIYKSIIFSSGAHLFKYQEEHHRFIFREWDWCEDPDENEDNRQNAEEYIEEISDLVREEKQRREINAQQKTVKRPKTRKRSSFG